MSDTWILVADRERARVFTAATPRAPLIEVQSITDENAIRHSREAKSDKPGRVQSRTTPRRASMEPHSDPKEVAIDQFAARVAAELTRGYNDHRYAKLGIAAEPSFLGRIRKHLKSNVEKVVAFEVPKDLVNLKPEEIREYLPHRF